MSSSKTANIPQQTSGSIKELFDTQGWAVIPADNRELLQNLPLRFLEELRKKELDFKDIQDFRLRAGELSDAKINHIRNSPLYNFSSLLIETFFSNVMEIAGTRRLFLQRVPHINVNIRERRNSVTMSHIELSSGHSPYTTVLWIPLHDIDDDSGLFCMNKTDSISFSLENNALKKPYDEVNVRSRIPPIKIGFGNAIIFNSYVLHGALPHTSSLARVSLDIRFQNCEKSLFEKDIEYFRYYELMGRGNTP
jgi:hypothetical protein